MNMMKRLMALLLAALMLCGVAMAEPADDDVMATVGDITVTRADYEGYLATLVNYYANYGYDTTDATILSTLQLFAMQTAVEYAVMDQKVVELGLALTEAETEAASAEAAEQWTATIEDGLAYYGITATSTEEERAQTLLSVLAELETMGYTEDSYMADALKYAEYEKVYAYITQDINVTDEEVETYYNSLVEADKATYSNDAAAYEQLQYMNQLYAMYGMTDYVTEAYYKPEGYRVVTHILLSADEALLTAYADLQATYEEQQNTLEEGGEVEGELVTAEQVEAARQAVLANVQPMVDEIKQKMADGATFAELIPQYTTVPGMQDEAAIAEGYEVHMDSVNWVIPFRDQAFTVDNIGDVTEPVVTDYGVHILQYVADVPGGPVELTEEMRASFLTALLSNAQNSAIQDTLTQWVEAADVVYSDEAKTIMGLTDTVAE